jgi:transglutaminase-like putative cysteine protease
MLGLLGTSSLVSGAQPQPTAAQAYQPPVTILRDDITYDVEADGTFTNDESESVRINTDQGVKTRSQLPISFSTSLQSLDILEAYTITKEGKKIDVPADKILVQQSPQSQGAPTFDDAKVKVIVFPAVEVGATINVHLRKTQKIPLFPNQFSMLEIFSKNTEFIAGQVTLRASQSLKLQIDAVDLAGGEVPSEQPGKRQWRWSVEKTQAMVPQMGSVAESDYSPRVAVSTFESYQAAASAYQERARSKAAVTPAIQALADEITQGVTGKREQAEALYRWVSSNVRYVAIYFGFGGVVPHQADDVAQLRYGDCKDHATLYEALLAAKGIRSSPALVNAASSYWLPKAPITPGVFNHVISYLPDFNLFVDSTPGIAVFGVLPIEECGKSALVADDGFGKPALVSLPLVDSKNATASVLTKLTIDSDGAIAGESTVSHSGGFDLVNRMIFNSFPKGMEAQIAGRILTFTGQTGTGTYVYGSPKDLAVPFVYKTRFSLPNYVTLPGPGAFSVPTGLGSLSGIFGAFDTAKDPKHEFAAPIIGGRREEVTIITLPKNVSGMVLPKAVKLNASFGHYESSYVIDGSVLTVTRTLTLDWPAATLQPENYEEFRTMGTTVARDLKAQVLFQ